MPATASRMALISNPLACKFDPGTLLCTGAETDACLTAPQIDAAKKIYAYSTNPRTKEKIFAGMAPGSEITWTAMAGGPNPFRDSGRVLQVFRLLESRLGLEAIRFRQGRRRSPTRSSRSC